LKLVDLDENGIEKQIFERIERRSMYENTDWIWRTWYYIKCN
jgi:hypothetical protein